MMSSDNVTLLHCIELLNKLYLRMRMITEHICMRMRIGRLIEFTCEFFKIYD